LHPYTEALFSVIPKLDPQKRTKKIILKGEIPSPVDPPLGCRFHTRCRYAKPICSQEEPIMEEKSSNHFVACHLV
ncbi:MAG TPA: oligopeptide/dipeptide ABC transporter ATP-binding protein, partial [Atribacterota bacterium]|nr:oligopeptide/dipeptide ABC transporter ATP-binding protein [Atribacterota bacterium]